MPTTGRPELSSPRGPSGRRTADDRPRSEAAPRTERRDLATSHRLDAREPESFEPPCLTCDERPYRYALETDDAQTGWGGREARNEQSPVSGGVGQLPAVSQVRRVADGDQQPVIAEEPGDRLAPGLGAWRVQQLMSSVEKLLRSCLDIGHLELDAGLRPREI